MNTGQLFQTTDIETAGDQIVSRRLFRKVALGFVLCMHVSGVINFAQGEFATFLKSESRDRQEILQRIFATEIFAGVEQVLEASRKAADDEREAAQSAVDTAIGAVFGRLPDGHDPEFIDDCRADQGREPVLRAIDSLVTQIDTDLTAARRDLAAADSGKGTAIAVVLIDHQIVG